MHDYDNDIVVSGAGGSNYIKVGPRTNKKTGVVMPLKQAQEAARLKKKPKDKAAKNKKGVVGGKRIKPVTAKPKGKRKPMSRG